MVLTDNRIELRPVNTGGHRESIEITVGLAAREVIIRDGILDLKENARFTNAFLGLISCRTTTSYSRTYSSVIS
ncbi:hypothetical protein [Desulfoscipio gibsoniae]|uniref:hypothetical protein n=1 Tax=Desulfoscipio gibsoniae TaxID=102134 RepID=UPI00059E2054|nr:hypothetical protein [Desulfoscipio gibsoniae]